jgi:hypothetical protein
MIATRQDWQDFFCQKGLKQNLSIKPDWFSYPLHNFIINSSGN